MPRLIISYDMNTEGPESSRARKVFQNKLGQFGWANEILVDGTWETLPDTTLVSGRSDAEALSDVAGAEAIAKRIEPAFEVKKYVISGYRRVGIRSDDTRMDEPPPTMRDLMRKIRGT